MTEPTTAPVPPTEPPATETLPLRLAKHKKTTKEARDWALQQGLPVKMKGKMAAQHLAAYLDHLDQQEAEAGQPEEPGDWTVPVVPGR